MSNIIKKNFKNNILFNFINSIASVDSNNEYYILNNESYKKGQINNLIEEFINNIKEYYIKSKQFYLERNMNYKRFLTIIRQICKSQNIKFEIKINYIKSKYEIIYHIYLEEYISQSTINSENNNNDNNDNNDSND